MDDNSTGVLAFIQSELRTGGRNMAEIGRAIGVTRQTIVNFKRGKVRRVGAVAKKLEQYLKEDYYLHGVCGNCHYAVKGAHGDQVAYICRKHLTIMTASHVELMDEEQPCFRSKKKAAKRGGAL